MSLDWNLTDVKDRDVNFPPDAMGKMNDFVHITIFATMTVGIYEITEKNADEFYDRLKFWYDAVGPLFTLLNQETNEPEPIMPTREQIHQLVGLHTNAATITKAQFLKHAWETATRR